MGSQPVKVFKVVRDGAELSPIPFEIQFSHADVPGSETTMEFVVIPEAPAGMTLLLASVIRWDKRGKQSVDLNGMSAFFEAAMPPADYERFRAAIEDPKLVVPMDTLGEIFEWLAGDVYSERPTSPSRTSSGGRRRTGGTSRATRPSGA